MIPIDRQIFQTYKRKLLVEATFATLEKCRFRIPVLYSIETTFK